MTKQQYRDARKLIEDPAHWCQHTAYCTDENGVVVARCAMGAVSMIAANDHVYELRQAATEINGHWAVSALNDATDHATVLRMFDRAIELAKE